MLILKKDSNRTFEKSRFFNLFFNNRIVLFLTVSLLLFLNILVLFQLRSLFIPFGTIFNIIGPPLIFSGLVYYLVNPLVAYFEKKGLSKKVSILLIYFLILLLLVIGTFWLFPIAQQQVNQFVDSWPVYWNQIQAFFGDAIQTGTFTNIVERIEASNIIQTVSQRANEIVSATILGIGSVIGIVTQIGLTIFTLPLILYYMVVDGKSIPNNIMRITPTKWRQPIMEVLSSINYQLGYYVRGQMIVAFAVAIIFSIGFWVIGLEYALLLGVLSGILNLIPYIGSFIAAGIALVIAAFTSIWMVFLVIVVLMIEQVLEGRLVQPLVLGNQLNIHPVVIIFLLLIGGSLFGLFGFLLAIPAYATFKIIFSSIFSYIHDHSELYADKESEPFDMHDAVIDVPDQDIDEKL